MSDREERIRGLFNRFNTGEDANYLTKKELYRILDALDPNCPDKAGEVQYYMDNNDTNRDKKISYAEFRAAFDKRRNVDISNEELLRTFKSFDKDGSGYIEASELTAMLIAKKGWSKNQCDQCIKQCDTDHDGKVNYKEFQSNFMS